MERVMRVGEWARDTRCDELEVFLRCHRDWIYCLALQIVGCHELAEDVSQEVLIRAARNLHKLRVPDSERAWLRRITVRRALSHMRDREFLGTQAETQHETDPTQAMAVRQTLGRLKPGQRAILALCCGEELAYEEIAEALSIPVGTVGSRIHTAKAAFKTLWEAGQ